MPSRRRAIPFAPSVCLALIWVLAGCSGRPVGLLAAAPDLERRGPLDAAEAASARGLAIECGAGQPWLARLAQRGFDGGLELLDASGQHRAAVTGATRGSGDEYLFAEAAPAGPRRLRIVAQRPASGAAHYELQVFCLRAPAAAALEALRAMNAAGDPARATDPARRDAAVARYETAEKYWTQLGETALAGDVALQLAGLHYHERDAWAAAVTAARRAAAADTGASAPWRRAAARLIEGAALLEQARSGRAPASSSGAVVPPATDDWEAAARALREAAALYHAAGATVETAEVGVFQGTLAYERGDLDAAVAAFAAAGSTLRAAGALAPAHTVANNLAAVRLDRGDYAGALRDYEALLASMPSTPDATRATTLQNLAAAASATGQSERALQAYRESLDIGQALGARDTVARALAGLGVNHGRLGHVDLALTYLRDAVALRRGEDRPDALAQALTTLGNAYLQGGEPRLASAAHREAVALLGDAAAPLLRARIELALGCDQAAAGEHAPAIATLSAALARLPRSSQGLESRLLVARAASRRAVGEFVGAAADVARAQQFARAGDDRETLIAAQVEAAQLAHARGDAALALRTIDAAVGDIERLPVGATNPENRRTLRTRLRAAFDLRVRLLADASLQAAARGDVATARRLALEALRASAGAGLPGHAAAHAGPASRADVDPDAAVYAQLASRRDRLEALAERHATPTPTMRGLEREIALLRTRLATGGRAAAVAVTAPSSGTAAAVAAARDARLPADVAILAYSLGDASGWAWTVTRERVTLRALPPRARIDAAVAQLLRQVRTPDSDPANTTRALEALRRLVLPPAGALGAARRWRIVPEGSLGAIPWALLAPRAGVDSVVLLPTAGAVFDAGRDANPAPRSAAPALQLALFGDPVFDVDDARLAGVAAAPGARLAGDESDPRRLARLPGTAREVAAIAQLAGTDVRLEATGLAATREAVLQLPTAGIDVLHLATHAVIDAEVPELAAVVLSRVDAAGRRIAGSLRPHDILRLPRAPGLVVLSACDAATDPGGAAEGRMNLVGAFLVGGARHVVASLWSASDAATTELMTRFYAGLLQQHLDPETALTRAQRELAASTRWQSPFYWAGFVVTQAAP